MGSVCDWTEVVGYEVDSGGDTPVSREELMQRARQRAEAPQAQLCAENTPADSYVVLESGLDMVHENSTRRVFLESWAYVTDSVRGHFSCSGGIELLRAGQRSAAPRPGTRPRDRRICRRRHPRW